MTWTLNLPDKLLERLHRIAVERGVPADSLVAEWIASLPGEGDAAAIADEDDDLVACTRAILTGSEPPAKANWDELMDVLAATEPRYATVEEAMSELRGGQWAKDG